MKMVIVTGMSGAGKSTALNVLEDEGYYCVDNMPISLVVKFAVWRQVRKKDIQTLRWELISAAATHSGNSMRF